MFETGDILTTWQVPNDPMEWPEKTMNCTKIFDHRKIYLDYEGPLSRNRGQVKRCERGTYHPFEMSDRLWQVQLQSGELNGLLCLNHLEQDKWQLTFKPA